MWVRGSAYMRICYCCVHIVVCCAVVWIALTNILFIDKSITVQILFIYLLYGISYGFDITPDLLVMAWNFKDILIFFLIDFDR